MTNSQGSGKASQRRQLRAKEATESQGERDRLRAACEHLEKGLL